MKSEKTTLSAKEIRDRYKLDFKPRRIDQGITAFELEGVDMYNKRLKYLLDHKRRGDMKLVGEIVGISADYALKAISRSDSKYHADVIDAFEEIVENRRHILAKKS